MTESDRSAKSVKNATISDKAARGFTNEEQAAMKERARNMKRSQP